MPKIFIYSDLSDTSRQTDYKYSVKMTKTSVNYCLHFISVVVVIILKHLRANVVVSCIVLAYIYIDCIVERIYSHA